MAEERDYRKEFVQHMDSLEDLVKLSKEDSRPVHKDKNQSKLREFAYNTIDQYRDIIASAGLFDISSITGPDSLKKPENQEALKWGYEFGQGTINEYSADILTNNLNGVLNGVQKEKLEQILNKAIGENLSFGDLVESNYGDLAKEYSEVLKSYKNYSGIKGLVDKYKKGGRMGEEETMVLYGGIAEIAANNIKEKLKEKGLSEEMQKSGSSIVGILIKSGNINKDSINAHVDKLVKDAEEKFRREESEKGKNISDYVTKALDKLVKDENPEKFNIARSVIYSMLKDK